MPALVVPRGQMKTNLLGMSFLDRLESWEVRADKLMLHGYPDVEARQRAATAAIGAHPRPARSHRAARRRRRPA